MSSDGTLYHGGVRGLGPGDLLVPSPPVVLDDCPICQARAAGRAFTVGEYRAWITTWPQDAPQARQVLALLDGAPDSLPIDPPSQREAVYLTSERNYARWYAARSGGDLYSVVPAGPLTASTEDPFPSWTCDGALIVAVEERRVRLTRKARRALFRAWGKADRRAAVGARR